MKYIFSKKYILPLFTSRSNRSGGTHKGYATALSGKAAKRRAEGILRPWSSPFLPNLLRPEIQAHFTPLHLAFIVEVSSPKSSLL